MDYNGLINKLLISQYSRLHNMHTHHDFDRLDQFISAQFVLRNV